MTPIVGNTYDKYGTRNRIARLLMRRFLAEVLELTRGAAPQSILEVGCGEGHLIGHVASKLTGVEHLAACDLALSRIAPGVDSRVKFAVGSAYELPYADRSFDLVLCCEVLEHLAEPERAMRELCRVSARHVLVSTPREPLWRLLNLMRLTYVRSLGNTPGHIQHFSPRTLRDLVNRHCNLRNVALPLPWIVILAEPRRASSAAQGPEAR